MTGIPGHNNSHSGVQSPTAPCHPSHCNAPLIILGFVKASIAHLPDPPVPNQVKEAEMDELFSFIGEKKIQIYIITIVDRLTRCYLGCQVVWQRTQEAIQELVNEVPKAKCYYSDAFYAYDRLWYHWGVYEVSQGKTDTYSVKADNAKLRHYLARLGQLALPRRAEGCLEAIYVLFQPTPTA